MPRIDVHFLPQLIEPERLAGGVSLVIDVLRATTTITTALAAGAREVLPCLEVDEARAAAANLPAGQVVLGGERGGVRIEGFTFGNSPREYTPEAIAGKTLVFTTTNGTRCMWHAQAAEEVWLAAFVNLSAVVAACRDRADRHLMCWDGWADYEGRRAFGRCDRRAFDGPRCRRAERPGCHRPGRLAASHRAAPIGTGAAIAPRPQLSAALAKTLRETQGGRNLIRLGLADDLEDAAAVDRHQLVPWFDPHTGRIGVRIEPRPAQGFVKSGVGGDSDRRQWTPSRESRRSESPPTIAVRPKRRLCKHPALARSGLCAGRSFRVHLPV